MGHVGWGLGVTGLSVMVMPTGGLSGNEREIEVTITRHSRAECVSARFVLSSTGRVGGKQMMGRRGTTGVGTYLHGLVGRCRRVLSSVRCRSGVSYARLVRIVAQRRRGGKVAFGAMIGRCLSVVRTSSHGGSRGLCGVTYTGFLGRVGNSFPLMRLDPARVRDFTSMVGTRKLGRASVEVCLALVGMVLGCTEGVGCMACLIRPFILFGVPIDGVERLSLSISRLGGVHSIGLFGSIRVVTQSVFVLACCLNNVGLESLVRCSFAGKGYVECVERGAHGDGGGRGRVTFAVRPRTRAVVRQCVSRGKGLIFNGCRSCRGMCDLIFERVKGIASLTNVGEGISCCSTEGAFTRRNCSVNVRVRGVRCYVNRDVGGGHPVFGCVQVVRRRTSGIFERVFSRLLG